jgi:hypothetical protein
VLLVRRVLAHASVRTVANGAAETFWPQAVRMAQ